MPLSFDLAQLKSRAARAVATGSSNGVRRFAVSGMRDSEPDSGGLVQKLWNGFLRFGGSLLTKVWESLSVALSFSFTLLWSVIVSVSQYIWNFNWNVTEAQNNQQIQSLFTSLAGSAGTTLGNAVGWLACGAIPGMVIASFNEPLGLYVLKNVGEEAAEEIAANLANLIRQTAIQGSQVLLSWMYTQVRKFWRKEDSVFRQELMKTGKLKKEDIDKAIADRNKPWSFASASEEAIEAIPNETLRTFVENFFEEAADACIEAGYVVAGAVDSYMASAKVANQGLLGPERTVEILLDRSTEPDPQPTT
ncbi:MULTISPECIES: hypothetical protein [Cyanophyceae]|uniref:hypothetical protein n=1 Tax=Cyanophyceae TaxID=3028117 RepID=UPI001681CCAC|nr:hypothetical protein [Trichocoleus sp. FACHB-40]MBD2001920.1 hypothetical protein [Trichocoleus sp. FACHB-40]